MADIFCVFWRAQVPTPFMTLTFLGGRTADGEGCRTFCSKGVHAGLDSIAPLRDGSEYFSRALEQISSRMGVSLLSVSHTVTLFISAVCSFVVCSCSSSNNGSRSSCGRATQKMKCASRGDVGYVTTARSTVVPGSTLKKARVSQSRNSRKCEGDLCCHFTIAYLPP